MKFFFNYANGLAVINTEDMGRLPSGRLWLHIEEVCAPEVGKRVLSSFSDDLVITQLADDGQPEPLFVWTARSRPNSQDEKFMKREIERRSGFKIVDEPTPADFERINRAAEKRARKAMKRREGKAA